MISILLRPGRGYSAEYGSLLILTSWIADADTPARLASTPSTMIVTPPVAIEPASTNRGHRSDVVLVENRQIIERLAAQGDSVEIIRRVCADLGRLVADRDGLSYLGYAEPNHQRRWRPGAADPDPNGRGLQPFVFNANFIAARLNPV